jgi:hypothetical protein
MNAREGGRQSRWHGSTALGEPGNRKETRPPCVNSTPRVPIRNTSAARPILFAVVTLTALAAIVVVGGIVANHVPAWAMAVGIIGVFTVGICVLARSEGSS